MNYYIQGNKEKADKIKAAFEELGINVLGFGFADKAVVYCSIGECVQYLPYSINLMNILYSHPDYKELELAVKSKFKVGDWIVRNNGSVIYGWNNPNWRSVKDELPEKDNEFEDYSKLVVVTDGKDFYKGMYNYGGECWLTHDLWPIEDATYWMEVQLPQQPRKEEQL